MRPKEGNDESKEWNGMFTCIIEESGKIYCTYNPRIAIHIKR